jgi:MFS family permease
MNAGGAPDAVDSRRKWRAMALLLASQAAAMTVWFSSAAALPSILAEAPLSDFQAALLTSSVQVGFVVGTLTSAVLGLADRLDSRKFFAGSAIVAALASFVLAILPPESPLVPLLRFVTGAAMAGVYPVGMRMAATWAVRDTGLLIGLLIGALTLGTAAPHLMAALGGLDWRITYVGAGGCALLAAVIIAFVEIGPSLRRAARFEPRFVLEIWQNRPARLATLGYLGHMWELYAMWAWIGAFLQASFALSLGADAKSLAGFAGFFVVGVGSLGCVLGGFFADRWGRTTFTMLAMAVSGACALLCGLAFGAAPWLVVALCAVWGFSVIADSAQFSASVAELSPPEKVGTMLMVQTCLGFLLTLATIHLMPIAVEALGWRWAFMPLAIGPFLGVWAMATLRADPGSLKLAGGRR